MAPTASECFAGKALGGVGSHRGRMEDKEIVLPGKGVVKKHPSFTGKAQRQQAWGRGKMTPPPLIQQDLLGHVFHGTGPFELVLGLGSACSPFFTSFSLARCIPSFNLFKALYSLALKDHLSVHIFS